MSSTFNSIQYLLPLSIYMYINAAFGRVLTNYVAALWVKLASPVLYDETAVG
jgi:hypothetical protein